MNITPFLAGLIEHEYRVAGTSIRDLSKKYGVPKSTIQRHIKKGGKSKVGSKAVFKNDEEIELKNG